MHVGVENNPNEFEGNNINLNLEYFIWPKVIEINFESLYSKMWR